MEPVTVRCYLCGNTVPSFMGVPDPHKCVSFKVTTTNTTNTKEATE